MSLLSSLPFSSQLPLLLLFLLSLCILPVPSLSADCEVDHTPQTLITFDLSHPGGESNQGTVKMNLVEPTLAKLSGIKGRVAVISIAGGYRTGKSFFLNQLLPPMSKGTGSITAGRFAVGDTTEAQTQEVQVHVIPACALQSFGLQDPELTVLFMDTPGLFSPDRWKLYDSQLLALLNMLSSVILYNTKGLVERNDIEHLSVAMETAFLLSFFTSKDGSEQRVDLDRPHLLWLFQSFQFNMTTTNGRDYLLLKLNQTDSGQKGLHSFTDRFLRFFASLDARTFPYPSEHTDDLGKLQTLTWEDLTPAYHAAIEEARHTVIGLAKVKRIGGADMSGEMLVDMVKTWTEMTAIKASDLSERGTEVLFKEMMKKEIERARTAYQAQVAAIALPTSRTKLKERSEEIVRGITQGKEGIPRYLLEVEQMVKALYEELRTQNEALLTKESAKLKELAATVLAYGKTEVGRLGGNSAVFTADQLEGVDSDMEAKWKSGVQAMSEAQQSMAAEFKPEWATPWAKLRESSRASNSMQSLSQCSQRAHLINDYYQTRSPLLDWQTEEEFTALVQALSTTSAAIPDYMLKGAKDVACMGEGRDSADVKDLYGDTARAFAQVHRMQVTAVTMAQIVLLGLTIYAGMRVSTYVNALGGGALRARDVDAREGYNCYLMTAGALLAGWLAKSGVDGVWSAVLAWLMAAVLLGAGGLALKLRLKTREQQSKDLYENHNHA